MAFSLVYDFGGILLAQILLCTLSLHKSLFEHAVGYYREHGKRVKRKRSKLPALKSSPTSPVGSMFPPSGTPFSSSTGPTPSTNASQTSSQGGSGPNPVERWMFRYDFKAAYFAEFRQDHKAAIK
jgi:trafficking protein particle complex subunit 11